MLQTTVGTTKAVRLPNEYGKTRIVNNDCLIMIGQSGFYYVYPMMWMDKYIPNYFESDFIVKYRLSGCYSNKIQNKTNLKSLLLDKWNLISAHWLEHTHYVVHNIRAWKCIFVECCVWCCCCCCCCMLCIIISVCPGDIRRHSMHVCMHRGIRWSGRYEHLVTATKPILPVQLQNII